MTTNEICSILMLYQHGKITDFTQKWDALPRMRVEELLSYGGIGLGAAVDKDGSIAGEVVVMDGVAYCTDKSGNTRIMEAEENVGFAQVSHIDPDCTIEKLQVSCLEDVVKQAQELLPSEEKEAFVVRLRGKFKGLTVRTVGGVGKQYQDFNALLTDQSSFTMMPDVVCDVSGVFNRSGFVSSCESPSGLHLHVVDQDRQVGGHVIKFDDFQGTMEIMTVKAWLILMSKTVGEPLMRLATLENGEHPQSWCQYVQEHKYVDNDRLAQPNKQ